MASLQSMPFIDNSVMRHASRSSRLHLPSIIFSINKVSGGFIFHIDTEIREPNHIIPPTSRLVNSEFIGVTDGSMGESKASVSSTAHSGVGDSS